MGDPYAPPLARFPDVRLERAGLNPDVLNGLRADFDGASDASKRRLVLLVASMSDADLAGPDGSKGSGLAQWPVATASSAGRALTEQEKAQAGSPVTDGEPYDPTDHTVPEVEAYLNRVPDAAEVDRVEAVENARTDRDPRVGVLAACQDARERIAAGGI